MTTKDSAQASTTQPKEQDKSIRPTFQEIVLQGKYNPALFSSIQIASNPLASEVVQRGLETMETREFLQGDLISNSNRCTARFHRRNTKASELTKLEVKQCSYCGQQSDPKELYIYFTLVHANDLLAKELLKRSDEKTRDQCIFKGMLIWDLETKMRDVREQELVTINKDCLLVCPTRCSQCMKPKPLEPPARMVEKATQTDLSVD